MTGNEMHRSGAMDKAFTKELDAGLESAECRLPKASLSRRYVCALYIKAFFVLALVAGLFFAAPWYGIHQYNELQRKHAAVGAQWRQMDRHYGRCADLGRHLAAVLIFHEVDVAKTLRDLGDAAHRLAPSARAAAFGQNQQALDKLQDAHQQLSRSLSELMVVAQAHPELASSIRFNDMTAQLKFADARLAYARQRYIAAVADYDLASSGFPAQLVAMQFEKPSWPGFRLEDESFPPEVPAASGGQ
jgi:LemA protein